MDDAQLLRYSRQILLPEVGIEGQLHLTNAKVLIVGMGGLGSVVALYLAASGVGELRLCDHDKVDLSNLQRQIVHTQDDIGQFKVLSAQAKLLAINPLVKVIPLQQPFDEKSANQVLGVDVVVDCTDNLATRLLVNRFCVAYKRPLVSGAVIRMEGQVAVFRGDHVDSPCYQCLYTQRQLTEESCAQTGILSPVVGVIGSLQALETLKLIMGIGETLKGRLWWLDALTMEWYETRLSKNRNCPVCYGPHTSG